MAHDATVAGRQRPPSMPDGTEGRFGECGTEPRVPPPGLSGAMLPGTLVVAGTERSPAGEVPGAREDAHVDADLSDHHLRGPLFHTGDRTDPLQVLGKGGEKQANLLADGLDGLLDVVDMRQDLAEEKGVMRAKAPTERLPEGGELLAERAAREVGQCVGIRGPAHEGIKHRAPRHPEARSIMRSMVPSLCETP